MSVVWDRKAGYKTCLGIDTLFSHLGSFCMGLDAVQLYFCIPDKF